VVGVKVEVGVMVGVVVRDVIGGDWVMVGVGIAIDSGVGVAAVAFRDWAWS